MPRINHAIAKIVARRVEKRQARARAELKFLRVQYAAAAHLLSSDLTAYLVEEVVQFFPTYLGLHPAGIPRVELPRRLFISTLRGRGQTRREREGGNVKALFSLAPLNVTGRACSLAFLRMLSKDVGCS